MQQHYYINPWAYAGDLTPGGIEEGVDPSGYVSYTQGWTFDYQRNLQTDSLAKSIQRVTMNSVLNDATTALQNLQQYGTPEFIDTADNGGTPFPYDAGAIIRYSSTGFKPFAVFMSVVTNNTDIPGTSAKWINLTQLFTSRIILEETLQIYVSSTGSDSNTGLTPESPLLDIQTAIYLAYDFYDWNDQSVVINVTAGTFTFAQIVAFPTGWGPNSSLTVTGVGETTILQSTGSNGCIMASGGNITVANMQITGGNGLVTNYGGSIVDGGGLVFGACAGSHMLANGGRILLFNNYEIIGSANGHWQTYNGGSIGIYENPVVSGVGAQSFTAGFAVAETGTIEVSGITFSGCGAFTGPRFSVSLGGSVDTGTGNLTFLPGNSAGVGLWSSGGTNYNFGFYN